MLQTKFVEKIKKTHFVFSNSFFFEIPALYLGGTR